MARMLLDGPWFAAGTSSHVRHNDRILSLFLMWKSRHSWCCSQRIGSSVTRLRVSESLLSLRRTQAFDQCRRIQIQGAGHLQDIEQADIPLANDRKEGEGRARPGKDSAGPRRTWRRPLGCTGPTSARWNGSIAAVRETLRKRRCWAGGSATPIRRWRTK